MMSNRETNPRYVPPQSLIIGPAVLTYWPPARFGLIR
jgi:hypothetical protein